jgi:hypothetical protein
MTCRRFPVLLPLLSAGLLFASACYAQGQTRPAKARESHIPIPGGSGASADPAALLDGILNEAKENSFAKKLAEEIAKHPEKYQADLEALKKQFPREFEAIAKGQLPMNLDPKDPRLQETMRQFVKNNKELFKGNENTLPEKLKELQGNPDKIKELQERIKPLVAPPSAEGPQGNQGGGNPNVPPQGSPNQNPPESPKTPDPAKNNPGQPPAMSPENTGNPEGSNTLTQRAFDAGKTAIDKMEKLVGESVDLSALFGRVKLSADGDGSSWLEKRLGMNAELFDNLGRRLNPEQWASKLGGMIPAGMHMPSISFGGLQNPYSNVAQATSEAAQSDKKWSLVLILAFAGMAFLVIWKGLAQRNERAARNAGFNLGSWPVVPGQVRSGPELIKAFEYLSLLYLGRAARTLNHREIAKSLGQTKEIASFEQLQATEALAALYEQARYAPWGASLPESDLSMARRHLSLLAGARSA